MVETWLLGATATSIVVLAYLVISGTIALSLWRSRQFRSNPLAVATAAIFLSCGIGHSVHLVHVLEGAVGQAGELTAASLLTLGDWHFWAWEMVTAGVALWYLTLRQRLPGLVRGAAMFEDVRVRQRQALEIHDNVVQGIAEAKVFLELGETARAQQILDRTLASGRGIITGLLGEPGSPNALQAGDFRRDKPAPSGGGHL